MSTQLRLAAAIALIAIAGVAVFIAGGGPKPPTTSPTPTPPAASETPSPTNVGTLDTSQWIAYTSERYGFDIKRPPNWSETPSDHVWQLSESAEIPPSAGEHFVYEGLGVDMGVGVSTWSVALAAGTSLDAWIQTYCGSAAQLCPANMSLDRSSPITTADGHAGVIFAGPSEDSRAFVLVYDRVYIISVWRTDSDPSVIEFGGGRRLVASYVSTLTLRPGGPAPEASPPALTGSFTSTLYGYSIDFPDAFWTATAGTAVWDPSASIDGFSDTFLPPSTNNGFRATSGVIPAGVVVDDWIAENVTGTDGECAPARSTLGNIVVDGATGKVRISCEEVEATVVVGDRLYLFTLFLDSGEPYSTAGSRALFEAMIATVQLTPETAELAPSAAPS
jgi:hypothetical protein